MYASHLAPARTATLVLALFFIGCHKQATAPPTETPSQAANPTPRPAAFTQPTSSEPNQAPPARPSGPVTFTDVTSAAGIRFRHNNGAFGSKYLPETMGSGVCVIDYDGDGLQDVFFVNSSDWQGHVKTHSTGALYHNNGDGTFTDVTRGSGLAIEILWNGLRRR